MDTSRILDSTSIEDTVAAFAALGDPIRFRLLVILASEQQCVCDLQEAVGIAPNLLSYHLRVLRQARLVEATRRGRWVDYRVAPGAVGRLRSVLGEFDGDATS